MPTSWRQVLAIGAAHEPTKHKIQRAGARSHSMIVTMRTLCKAGADQERLPRHLGAAMTDDRSSERGLSPDEERNFEGMKHGA